MFENLYKPVEQRTPDSQFKDMLITVRDRGIRVPSQQDPNDRTKDALTLPYAYQMYFPVDNGAPIINDRKISFWKKGVNELYGFINGVHTLKGLNEVGCPGFWDDFATKEKCEKRGFQAGDLGPGSYGVAFHDFPMPNGKTFNQWEALIEQIKENPGLRTHFVSPWIPYLNFRVKKLGLKQQVVVSPCHGWVKVKIFGRNMVLQMMMRGNDIVVGGPSNMVQYYAILLGLAKATGYTPMAYNHIIMEPHIFVDQLDSVELMVARESLPLPTLSIRDEAADKDFFALRADDYILTDYNPHPAIPKIPVAI